MALQKVCIRAKIRSGLKPSWLDRLSCSLSMRKTPESRDRSALPSSIRHSHRSLRRLNRRSGLGASITLVTANISEFSRVKGLSWQDWAKP